MIKQKLFSDKVEVGISELSDGDMRYFDGKDENEIMQNQRKLGKTVSLDGERVARLRTVYDGREEYTDYQEVTDENVSEYSIEKPEKQIMISDGLVTRRSDVGILLPLADCIGIVVFDEEKDIVGLLHAGRQNIEQYGPKKYIDYLVREFGCDAGKLKLFFSPHAVNFQIYKLDNKTMPEAAKEQLTSAGVLLENIVDPGIDTVSSDNYPSYSGDNERRRFAVVVRQVE